MKKEKSRGSAKRLIIILSLTLALIIALGAFSFAWIRNYVAVDSLGIQTGKLLYDIKVYDGDGNKLSDVFTTPADDSNSTDEIVKATDANLEIKDSTEFFFVIKKHADSIDFDVALSFDWDKATGSNYDYVGQLEYSMYDASSELLDVTFDNITANYISNAGDANYPTPFEKLTSIFDKTQKTSLSGETDTYACIRLKITVPEGETNIDLSNKNFHLKTKFCVAQTGALDDGGAIETIRVTDTASLKDAMASYGYGDTIYIESSDPAKPITHDGDLVFTRPCKVVLVRTTLEITGNLIFSYIYDDYFELSTAADGHIKVMKNGAGDGGHFQIELPNSTMKLTGANNVAEGKADVYVDGDFTANASTDEAKGITFERLKVCQAATADSAETLKPLTVDGSSRIVVANSTNLGALSTDGNCKKLHLINKGSIEAIDLKNMSQDTTYLLSPTIFIDNYGVVGGDKTIYLPGFSKKYDDTDTKSGLDNTRIIANKGSELIKAITPNDTFPGGADGYSPSDYFFSTGVKMTDGTTRDDIEYDNREIYVEKVNGDPTKIVVHYENIPPVLDGVARETLKSYIEYYSGENVSADQKIAAVKEITEMKVICYSGKVLDSKVDSKNGDSYSDYSFIKTMTALTTLDLSESGSEDMRVPDNAFKGMTALTDVKMPERDIIWGKNIFTNTGVDEITFPQALTMLDNSYYVSGGKDVVSANEVLDGIKYVYTSITVVGRIHLNTNTSPYFFVPDNYTRDAYRELYGSKYADWYAKIFLNNGVIRDGDFFYRVTTVDSNHPTCDFVAYTGTSRATATGFDFNSINGYTITSYDPYAFYDKLKYEEGIDLILNENILNIGEYAFACSSSTTNVSLGIKSIIIAGNPEIKGYSFQNNDKLVSFSAPLLVSLKGGYNLAYNDALETVNIPMLSVVEGNRDLYMCPKLERVDISVIEKNTTNAGFYSADKSTNYDKYIYARFYIHTENAMDITLYKEGFTALAADYRFIFVNATYAPFYRATSTYTGVTEMGNNTWKELIPANAEGTDLKAGEKLAYYYVINGNQAELVACMLPEINMAGENFVTISEFNHGGDKYPVKKIGSAVYHFTAIIAQNISIHEGVTEIGDYAFDAQKTDLGKYCITIDLNQVKKAGRSAFQGVNMAVVEGEKLEEVGKDTFTNNKNLRIANLPNLSRSRPQGSDEAASEIFSGCSELRAVYVGYSDDIAYNSTSSLQSNYIRFINYVDGATEITLPNVNTIINSNAVTSVSMSNNYLITDENFSDVITSDWYDCEVTITRNKANVPPIQIKGTLRLPGYIYSKNKGANKEVSLFSVSPDLNLRSFGDFRDSGLTYVTPNTVTDSNSAVYNVVSLGKYAYGAVGITGVEDFIIADNVKLLGVGALKASEASKNEKMLLGVERLILSNVTVVNADACRDSNIVKLEALKLEEIGSYAFYDCKLLQSVYFPSFKTAIGTYTFRNNYKLASVTLGENAVNLSGNMFDGCSALTKITILNKDNVVTLGGSYIVSSTQAPNVVVHVPASIYNQYEATYKSKTFGRIPVDEDHFKTFGNSSKIEIDNPENPSSPYVLTYYWEVIDGTTTAYLDYVEGTFPKSRVLELPSSLTSEAGTFTIVSVKPSLISALSEITDVTLPSGMSYLSFTTADLADSIKSLSIESNSKFKTVDGVLYTKDEDGTTKTLLVCPKALTTAGGKLTVADSVTEIFDKAFYGSKFITELEIAGAVTVRNEAFAGAGISTIKFTDTSAASVFAGKDIFLGANVNLQISVPSALLDDYKTNVLIDYSIKFITH